MLGCDDGSVRVWRDVSSSSSDALDSQSSHGNSNIGNSNNMTASGQHSMSYHGGTAGATGSAGGTTVNSSGSTVNNAVELVSSFSALPDVAEISRGYVCMYVCIYVYVFVTRMLQNHRAYCGCIICLRTRY